MEQQEALCCKLWRVEPDKIKKKTKKILIKLIIFATKDNIKNKGITWLIKCDIVEYLFVIKGNVTVLIYEFTIYFSILLANCLIFECTHLWQ